MDGEEIAAKLARLEVTSMIGAERLGALNESIKHIDTKLQGHITDEEDRLARIERHLSFGQMILFFGKAILLTIVAALTFKFGDISHFWRVK